MRVIAGIAKGHKLQAVPGDSTRPITDRAKETLFSILGDWIAETRILDRFGGIFAEELIARFSQSMQQHVLPCRIK